MAAHGLGKATELAMCVGSARVREGQPGGEHAEHCGARPRLGYVLQ